MLFRVEEAEPLTRVRAYHVEANSAEEAIAIIERGEVEIDCLETYEDPGEDPELTYTAQPVKGLYY